MNDDWLTPADYAALWYVGEQMVRKYIWDGKIPAEKVDGRWYLPPGLDKPPHNRRYQEDFTPKEIAERKAKKRQYQRDYAQRLKDQGICYLCKTRYAEPGRTRCAVCAEERRRKWRERYPEGNAERCRQRREELKAKGLCVNCRRPALPDRILCKTCAAKVAESQQVRKMRARIARENAREVREAKGNG